MRIGIDVRALQDGHRTRGIGTYVRELVWTLARTGKTHDVVLYYDKSLPLEPLDVPFEMRALSRPKGRGSWLWEQILLPLDIVRGGVDCYHQTAALTPDLAVAVPFCQPKPIVATVFDIGPLTSLSGEPYFRWLATTRAYRLQMVSLRRAACVLTISRFVHGELTQHLRLSSSRIGITPPGVGAPFRPLSDGQRKSRRAAFGLNRPFIFGIGEGPQKNLDGLLEAFARIARTNPAIELVLDNRRERPALAPRIQELGLQDRVRFIDHVPAEDLVTLYNAAEVLAFPSLSEGFGLPIIEAMACGCPVVTSTSTSLPEVAGDAAILIDPTSPGELAAALERVLHERPLRQRLVAGGLERSKTYTWKRTAELTLAAYESVTQRMPSGA